MKCELRNIRLTQYLIDSKREFAVLLNVEEHTYSQWESGKSTPKLEKALEVAQKLNKKVEDIWHL